MPKYSNTQAVPLSIAVFLATDHYDHDTTPNLISATALLKPVRQLVLARRVPTEDISVDLSQMMSSRMGSAIHDGIERAWLHPNLPDILAQLGYPKSIQERVVINPPAGMDLTNRIPIYLEQRAYREIDGFTVSGKFDFVGQGRVEDFKTMSVWAARKDTNKAKHILQGSIYRWLNPTLITQDEMAIQQIYTDWSQANAKQDPTYPQSRHQEKIYSLLSLGETEAFIVRKLAQITQFMHAPEEQIPECTEEELWRTEPVYKYYKNPASTARSTKNFPSLQEATIRLIEDGNVGLVKEVPGEVKACRFCDAFLVCTQKDRYLESGELTL